MNNEDIRGTVKPIDIQAPVGGQDQAQSGYIIDPSSPFALKPTRPEQKPHFDKVSEYCDRLYQVILEEVPSCADRTLALRALQETRMWANCAIVHDGKPSIPGAPFPPSK